MVEITEREENRSFAFVTGGTAMNFVHWRYDLDANNDGTTLTESWALMNLSPIMGENGESEVEMRSANARESITATLLGMKAAAEG